MIRSFLILLFAMTTLHTQAQDLPATIHGFEFTSLEGEKIDLSQYKGKKILIVYTASECGYTAQYDDLERVYSGNKDRVVVIGIPANNFGNREPGANEEIGEFCERNYGVSFPMSEKISVKGNDMAPMYLW